MVCPQGDVVDVMQTIKVCGIVCVTLFFEQGKNNSIGDFTERLVVHGADKICGGVQQVTGITVPQVILIHFFQGDMRVVPVFYK
jgi:hypothetical protein